jgi:CRISPR-associated endonuclease/helicase Cas3
MTTLLSHPDKKLIDHLSETAKTARETIQGKSYDFSLDFNGSQYDLSKLLPDLVWLATAFHDIGKATSFFQKYIRNPEDIHDKKKSHALLSALFVYFVVKKYLDTKKIEGNLKELLATFTFTAVKRHHGKLDDLSNELFLGDYEELLKEQVKAVDEKLVSDIIENQIAGYQFKISWENFRKFVENEEYKEPFENFSFDFLDDRLNELRNKTRLSLFYLHQVIYSTLLFSDKNDVIISGQQARIFKSDILAKTKKYREVKGFNNPQKEINRLKNEAYYKSAENLDKVFSKDKHIYSVTLPTGLGKTITTFMLADTIRKKTGFENSKIIITIPFTSIIDQNFEVYADILEIYDSSLLLKHHHLADPSYKTDENIANYDKSQFLIETWQSDIVVTTFVQLLETLFSCDKTKLMKLSQLAGSVILLDEIQTIPYPLWEPVREGFKILGKRFNLYFILISATQPLIFTPGKDIFEIIPYYQKYFKFFNRTRLHINKAPVGFDEFKATIIDYIGENQDKDILTIVNTKNAAKELFENIRDEIDTEQNELYFLTTLITPFERKEIIKRIKSNSDKRKIIISTQLVEAGVDISVDTVFRQLSPLDSIIQSAGRANRYSEKSYMADIFLYDIKDLRRASNTIYGSDLLIKTENVLKGFEGTVNESEYLKIIEKYFEEVRKQADNKSNKLFPAMLNFDFSKVNLKLIAERKTESVYVQLNEKAKELWEKYVEIYSLDNLKPWKRKALFGEFKSDFYDFVINVPIPWDKDTIVFDSEKKYGFYVSELDSPSINYNYSESDLTQNTGYNNEEQHTKFI